jgi:hypothetical protein
MMNIPTQINNLVAEYTRNTVFSTYNYLSVDHLLRLSARNKEIKVQLEILREQQKADEWLTEELDT